MASREIKFRGLSFDGKWVYGCPSPMIFSAQPDDDIAWIFTINKEIHRGGNTGGWIKVYRKSVGEYTGLKDKHGKEIYEGDIVKYEEDGGIFTVEYHQGSFDLISNEDEEYNSLIWIEPIEIIGNKFQNPELLEVKTK